ncbi:hypothetical protein RB195_008544 [Necator americanus]|uniref:Uncharacterized protein n=1 Tax=Necator americanus TaxID=51031 RepID=A0ABR1CP54_NECAM
MPTFSITNLATTLNGSETPSMDPSLITRANGSDVSFGSEEPSEIWRELSRYRKTFALVVHFLADPLKPITLLDELSYGDMGSEQK